jgi:Uma2 family endonuclease
MTIAQSPPTLSLPDHTQLPDSDGTFVKNFQEHPQCMLLTTSIRPVLDQLHPDGRYCIGQDSGIYWRLAEPLVTGAEAPDWFYVPNVAPLLDGQYRRSYVMWQEILAPLIVMEFVLDGDMEAWDTTSFLSSPNAKTGKFWIYEQAIRIPFYAIYEVQKAAVIVYKLVAGRYQQISPNKRDHYLIEPLGTELGIWHGRVDNHNLPWLRWWDSNGDLLLTGEERAEAAKHHADTEQQQANAEKQRADRLTAKLREMGIDPQDL